MGRHETFQPQRRSKLAARTELWLPEAGSRPLWTAISAKGFRYLLQNFE